MFGSTMLEVAIGLLFFYLLLGLVCSVVTEFISSRLRLRARYLEQGILTLLKDPLLVEQFYHLPMIESLRIDREKPPYIPPRSFALAILGLVTDANKEYASIHHIRQTLYNLPEDGATGSLKKTLLIMTDEAQDDTYRLQQNIEFWFTSTMDSIAGMYKRRIQTLIFATALIFTVAANVDTIGIARNISASPVLRDVTLWSLSNRDRSEPTLKVYPSTSYYPSPATPTPTIGPTLESNQPLSTGDNANARAVPSATVVSTPTPAPFLDFDQRLSAKELEAEAKLDAVENSSLRIGWSGNVRDFLSGSPVQLFNSLLGWLITSLAVTLFALVWFDLLNKFIVVRTAIKPYDTSQLPTHYDRAEPPNTSSM